jgi:cell division transport system permease protein
MSGSYDRPGGPRRPYPAPTRSPEPDLYDDPVTGPPATYGNDYAVPEATTQRDIYAARQQDLDFEPSHGPIVPAGSVTGQSLTLVIAIMCFLACLTARRPTPTPPFGPWCSS